MPALTLQSTAKVGLFSLAASKPGMVLMKPTSITHSGTSATLGANGQVTFSGITSLSLNGVFTADFDNYVLTYWASTVSGNNTMRGQFRVGGSDATGTDYVHQSLFANNTSVTASRDTAQTNTRLGPVRDAQRSASWVNIYGPYLAQPTAVRTVSADSYLDGTVQDFACTHSLSTSYDGITVFPNGSTATGALQVYGLRS